MPQLRSPQRQPLPATTAREPELLSPSLLFSTVKVTQKYRDEVVHKYDSCCGRCALRFCCCCSRCRSTRPPRTRRLKPSLLLPPPQHCWPVSPPPSHPPTRTTRSQRRASTLTSIERSSTMAKSSSASRGGWRWAPFVREVPSTGSSPTRYITQNRRPVLGPYGRP